MINLKPRRIKFKRGKWISTKTPPVRSGVYEIHREAQVYSYWNAETKQWGERSWVGIDFAYNFRDRTESATYPRTVLVWRGLTLEGWIEAKGCVERGEKYYDI